MPGKIFRTVLFLVLSACSLAAQNDRSIDSLEKVLANYNAAHRGIKPTLRDSVKANILDDITAKIFDSYPDKAMKYAYEQLALSERIGYKYGVAQACNTLGIIYDQKSDYVKAMAYHQRALAIRKEMKHPLGIADCYNNIAIIYSKQANYAEALNYMLKALAIAKSTNDDFGVAGTYNNIGTLYLSQDNLPEALKSFLNCIAMLDKLKDDGTKSIIEQNVGEIYMRQGKQALSRQHFEKGLQLAKRSGNMYSEANNYNSIALLLQHNKQYDQALDHFKKSLALRQKIDDRYGKAGSLINIGWVYFKQGKTSEAIQSINAALDLAKKAGELDLLQIGYEYLSDIYKNNGNYKLAYENHILYKQVTDSIFNIDKQEKFDQLQLKYNLKIAQDSVKGIQLRRETKLRDEATAQRNKRNVIYTVLGLAVIFLIILLLQRNKIAKIKRERALDEERNRISRDLHDNLGAQLSTARMLMVSLTDSETGNTKEIAGNSVSLLDASISDLRNVMDEMHDTVLLEHGYLAATEVLINKVKKLNGIDFSLTHHKMGERANARIEHQLYRITQEMINNTLKYAKAANVSIELLRSDGFLTLMYEDDGVGFDVNAVKKGYGLRNIETRVKSLGGSVNFDSMPSAGTRIIIEIPE
jgi:signal transduction histidine kinase